MPIIFNILLNNIKPEYNSEKTVIEQVLGRQSVLVDPNFDQTVNQKELTLGKLPQFCPESQIDVSVADEVDFSQRKKKVNYNLISDQKIELPTIREENQNLINQSLLSKAKLSDKQLPSIGVYKMLNTYRQLTAVTISEQSNYIVCGFEDSSIKVFDLRDDAPASSLEEQRMKELQSHFDPKNPQRNAVISGGGRVLNAKLDQGKQDNSFVLVGHSGPVYGLSVQLDDQFLISGGADKTIRLWDLGSKKLLVIYQGHNFPVW